MVKSLTRRLGRSSITCIGFLMLLLVATPAMAQLGGYGGANRNPGLRAPVPPKKFLPADGVAKAGKLEVSVASVAVGTVEIRDGEEEQMLVTLSVKNTDPKKRIPFGILLPSVKDDNGNSYSIPRVDAPKNFEPGDIAKLVVHVEVAAMKAKALRLVLADGIGWELKKADWEKAP